MLSPVRPSVRPSLRRRRRRRAAAVLFDALTVDAEAEDGAHLAEGGADLKAKWGGKRSKLIRDDGGSV